ncbi:MAG: toprim domain-containing protein [Bacteroidetes bacterium]|nr:toprim domain-containing protein [Bacteroidota bacterium]
MNIEQAKQVRIFDYLLSEGIRPVSENTETLVYFSPFRSETTPSFHIVKKTNFYKDFGTDEKAGDIINLVTKLHNTDTKGALKILSRKLFLDTDNNLSFYEQKETNLTPTMVTVTTPGIDEKTRNFENVTIQPVSNYSLIQYIEQRGIKQSIWKVQEKLFQMNYTAINKHGEKFKAFNLAWKNDFNGYELRAKGFKNCFRSKEITTIPGTGKGLNLFEGFFDYLSALQHFNTPKLKNTTIILNSLSLISKVLKQLEQSENINLFLDNDEIGIEATNKLINSFPNCVNKSLELYPEYHDFNDFLNKLKH